MNNRNRAPLTIAQKILTRNTGKLLQSFLSLLISAAVLTVILSLIGSVRLYLLSQSTELLGGDITIEKSTSFKAIESPALTELRQQGAVIATREQTTVMLTNSTRDKSVLSALKIVSQEYPLYGSIKTKPEGKNLSSDTRILAEQAFADRLGLQVGDTVFIGDVDYILEGILVSEPDQFSSGFPLGPKVLISEKGWKRSGILSEASRVQYGLLIKLPEKLKTSPLLSQVEQEFRSIRARVSYAADGPDRLLSILRVTERFFLTFILLSLFLVVVNIRTNLIFLLNYFLKTIAVLRMLGMSRNNVVSIFILLLIIISVVASVLGNIVGNILVIFALPQASTFVEGIQFQSPLLVENIYSALIFTVLISLFSALPILLKIMSIEPKMILTQVSQHQTKESIIQEILSTAVTVIALGIGMLYLIKNLNVTFITVGAVTGIFLIFVLLIQLLVSYLYKKRFSFPFVSRSIISFTKNQGIVGVSSIASLTLALTILFTLSFVQSNITNYLQSQVQKNAPNLYLLDIQQNQIEEIKPLLPTSFQLFSITRARFIRTDNRYYKRENPEDGEFLREFNITNRSSLIEGEKLIDGTWHGKTGLNQVSVEKEFAERAGITLGSEVEVSIQGVPVTTKVTSIREVETTQGLPFFFFVYSPDVLAKAPKTYFGYVNIPQNEIPLLQNRISTRFPSVSTIPTADIISTIQKVVETLSLAILVTSIPALLLGIFLVFGMMANIAQERFRNLLLFKVFGSSQRQVFSLYIFEALFSIIFASLFAFIFSAIVTYALNNYVFEFTGFYFSINIFWIILVVVVFTLLFAGYLIKTMMQKTPTELLREQ